MNPAASGGVHPAAENRAVVRLEETAARGWPAPETEWLGRWLLRAGEGWTRRANSVLALGEPDRPLDAALAAVGRWYTARGLRASFSVPLPTQQPLDDELAARSWTIDMDTAVLTTDLASATPAGGTGVRLADRPPPGWAAVYRGGTALPSVAERILTAPSVVTFASITHRDRIVATGRGVVTDGWLGIAAVEVLPDHRRRGLARKITSALRAWGTLHGATRCYLQVMSSNAPALALYADLGFSHHHSYRQRTCS